MGQHRLRDLVFEGVVCGLRTGYCIIEFLGEWNDAVHNDIMRLKRDFVDELIPLGIDKYILIGENILNFHADIPDYYDEWLEEVRRDGWPLSIFVRT